MGKMKLISELLIISDYLLIIINDLAHQTR